MFGTDAMIPTEFRRRLRSHTTGRRCGLKLTSAVVGAAWLAAPTISRADIIDIIDYGFSDASAVFGGIPETITGIVSFEQFSPGVAQEWFAEIRLTGPAPYAGLYSAGLNGEFTILTSSDTFIAASLKIRFANDLSLSPDPLASVEIGGVTGITTTDTTGKAVAVATPIKYDLSNVSTTVFNGTPEPITGFFYFDPLAPSIEYSAVFSTPLGSCINDTGPAFPREIIAICSDSILRLFFANDLSFAADPLTEVDLQNISGPGGGIDTAPTGEAVPVAGGLIPEPTTLALLGAALGLFLLSPRAIRRNGKPHPNQPEGA